MLQEFLKGEKVSITKYRFIAPLVNGNLRGKNPTTLFWNNSLKAQQTYFGTLK